MARRSVQGLAETFGLFDRLPDAATEQLLVEMAILGREISAAQKGDIAKDTGQTEAALTWRLVADQLKMRVGLFGSGSGRSNSRSRNLFVGRLIEGGRKAQTVLVTRRLKRQIRGNGRVRKDGTVSKRRVIYQGKPYKMRVSALPARPFIAQPIIVGAAEQHLAEFWSKTLPRAGATA